MSQNFNALRRWWWRLRTDPFLPPMVIGYALLLCAALACSSGVLAGCAAAWVVLAAILSRTCPLGHPRFLARELTPNFFAVRLWSGRWGIYQRPPAHGREGDCRALMKSLLEDRSRLPAALTPGRYLTITHETILTRLRRMPGVTDLRVRPAYTAAMAQIHMGMTRGRCKHCDKICPGGAKTLARQFYAVAFRIVPPRESVKRYKLMRCIHEN